MQGGNQAYGEIECPDATESDQGAYSCEAINIKGFCLHIPKYLFTTIVHSGPENLNKSR